MLKTIYSNYTNNKINLLTIHDCFPTNAYDVDKMISGVKLVILTLYSEKSFIAGYYNFIIEFKQKLDMT